MLNNLGILANEQGDHDCARDFYDRSVAIYRRLNLRSQLAAALSNLGSCHLSLDDPESARPALDEALNLQQQLGEQFNCANTLHNLAEMHLALGDPDSARRRFAETQRLRRALGTRDDGLTSLETLARIALAEALPQLAVLLYAAAAHSSETQEARPGPATQMRLDHGISEARALLPPDECRTLWEAGRNVNHNSALSADGEWSDELKTQAGIVHLPLPRNT